MSRIHPKQRSKPGPLPLAALRAFEAAARLGSFRDAAADVALTASAISHHVRGLEAMLGVRLFYRGHRHVVLTEAGARLAGDLTPAFAAISSAFHARRSARVVRLSAAPLFAAQFLMPRLDELAEFFPDMTIELESAIAPADLAAGKHDLALRFGPRPAPPLAAAEIGGAGVVMVAAPQIAAKVRVGPSLQPGHVPMLTLTLHPNAWADVCHLLGIETPRKELFFDSYDGVLRAAEGGRGLALIPRIVCEDQLAQGALVQIVERTFEGHWRYWLAGRPDALTASQFQRLARWLSALVP